MIVKKFLPYVVLKHTKTDEKIVFDTRTSFINYIMDHVKDYKVNDMYSYDKKMLAAKYLPQWMIV